MTGVALAVTATSAGSHVPSRRAAVVVLGAGVTATLGTIVAAGGAFFSYTAPWHVFALIPLWVVAAVGVGVCLGSALISSHDNEAPQVPLAGVVAARWLPVVVAAGLLLQLGWYLGPLSARTAAWDRGEPAPIAGIADVEASWVRVCAVELEESRAR